MALKDDIVKVLADPAVGSIDFKIGAFKVTKADYRKICALISSGKITPVSVSSKGRSGDAFYDFPNDRLLIGSALKLGTNDTSGLIIHECTHAIMDLRKLKINAHLGEAIAYVAQAVFQLQKGGKKFRRRVASGRAGVFLNVIKEAVRLVDSFNMLKGSASLKRKDVSQLIANVQKLSPYDKWSTKKEFQFDGI